MGPGKTVFTEGIRSIFGEDLVSTITLDDYHSLDRVQRQEQGITPLNPQANRIDQLEKDLRHLKCGVPIEKPVYNHTTGVFDPPVIFRPKKILILEGLHTLFTPALRKSLDFSLFVDPSTDVKYEWKIRRDVKKRGYSRKKRFSAKSKSGNRIMNSLSPPRKHLPTLLSGSIILNTGMNWA